MSEHGGIDISVSGIIDRKTEEIASLQAENEILKNGSQFRRSEQLLAELTEATKDKDDLYEDLEMTTEKMFKAENKLTALEKLVKDLSDSKTHYSILYHNLQKSIEEVEGLPEKKEILDGENIECFTANDMNRACNEVLDQCRLAWVKREQEHAEEIMKNVELEKQ